MVAQTRHAVAPSPKKLAFREKLVGKGLSTDVLIKKLQVLHRELAEMEQELVEVESLSSVRKELISATILHHKDRGVKAYTACCLADILRLTAPDAPYTQGELRDIFQFFFRQLTTGLKASDSPYYTEYFHLLESLSTVKSVVLVCDLQNSDELMLEIFRDFFQLVRRDLAKKIEMFLCDILVALIDECQTLPSDVLETIMAQFTDKNARIEQPAYRLAVQVCNSTADKLTRHVSQYFTEIIIQERDDDFSEIRDAHELIKRLWHSCPAVLPTVIPQLEEELQAEELQLRLIVTQVLGEMFADKSGGLDLTKQYPSTWTVWLKRRNDKSPAVRLKFVEGARVLLGSVPEQRDPVEEALAAKLLDPDDKVRAAVCRVYSHLDYETALHHVKTDQLRAVAGRGVDKKQSVRSEALHALGKLYSLAYPEIENKDTAAIVQFAWIPNELFQMIKISGEIRPIVEDVVAEYILPLPSPSISSTSKSAEVDEVAWTDRLLTVMAFLDDEHAVNMLLTISALQRSRPTIFEHFIESCTANNGGVIDENEEAITAKLSTVIKYISAAYPDPHKASDDLNAFAKLNEQRLYKLLKICMDLQTDIKSLVKATNEFVKRMDVVSSAVAPTMNFFVRQASLRMLNQSSLPTLLKRLQKTNPTTSGNALKLLTFVSKHNPALYKSHFGELVKGVADEKHPQLVEVSLQALAAIVRWDEKVVPTDKRTLERIKRLAVEGTPQQAKFAARFLAFSKNKATVCTEVVDIICDALGTTAPEVLVAHVAVLAQFARFAPDAFEHKSDVLMAFLLKDLLMIPTSPLDEDIDMDEEWADESEVSDNLRAKILALKVCRNRSLAHASADNALEIATPVLKMLATLLEHGGSFVAEAGEDPKVKSRMRLQAALSMLHLSTVPTYAKAIAPRFLKLAIVVQDTCFDVRMTFLKKLVTLSQPQKVPTHYNVIPFLTVHDPELDVKAMAMSYVNGIMRKLPIAKRVQHMEMMFIRLLHLLAHHPDFATSQEELIDIAKYIQFYLQQVANADTISLLYHLAMKGKTVRDAESQLHTENLYVVSELAQELIKIWAHTHSLNISTYPGKVKLPPDILRPLPDVKTANDISRTIFLSPQMLEWLKEKYNPKDRKEKEKKEKAERAAVKRKAPPKTNGNPTKRRRKRHSGHSEDFGSELSEEDMAEKSEPAVDTEEDAEPELSGEEKLGRGQRTRAKKKQARASKKAKHSSPSSEG
ncbi:armadillo-type protein [Mycena crocata]|nr:armadillo-type protein [Mycena crocata]